MPIYEYKCRVCDEHFEVEQSFTDDSLTEIDGCSFDESGRHRVRKVFAAPAIAFKGDGFYRNDARSSSKASSSESAAVSGNGSSSSDSSSSESSGSDSKSDDKSPSKPSSSNDSSTNSKTDKTPSTSTTSASPGD